MAPDYKEKLNEHKSDRAKALEIKYAIDYHIKVNIDEDPEYYKKLSERLKDIIAECEDKWDLLVQMLLEMRDSVEEVRRTDAGELGLSEIEYSFHNILMAEVTKQLGEDIVDGDTHKRIIEVVKQLVVMMEEATSIVGFFDKWNSQKTVKKEIKRTILEESFGSKELVSAITDRFMELAKVKFK